MELHDADAFLHAHAQAVLAVPRTDGSPHVSRIVHAFDGQVARVSLTDSRVKTGLLRDAGTASLHVRGDDDWHWVTLECDAELTAVAAAPDDDVVGELLEMYEAVQGQHPDPDEFRAAMVDDGRLVLRLTPRRVYGQL